MVGLCIVSCVLLLLYRCIAARVLAACVFVFVFVCVVSWFPCVVLLVWCVSCFCVCCLCICCFVCCSECSLLCTVVGVWCMLVCVLVVCVFSFSCVVSRVLFVCLFVCVLVVSLLLVLVLCVCIVVFMSCFCWCCVFVGFELFALMLVCCRFRVL